MNFNKEQREGAAKVADNLATALAISAVIAGVVDHKIGWQQGVALFAGFFVLLFVAYHIRKGEDHD